MNIEEAKNAIITNKEVISSSIKSLFDEYKGTDNLNGFEEKLNTIFSQFGIPLSIKILVGSGNVNIYPTDENSKQLIEICQDNNIF